MSFAEILHSHFSLTPLLVRDELLSFKFTSPDGVPTCSIPLVSMEPKGMFTITITFATV